MKLIGSISRLAFCGALASGLALIPSVWAAQGSATITYISGRAQVSSDGSTWTDAAVAKMVAPGASIKSASPGQVDLQLAANGGSVQLAAGTELKIERLNLQSSGAGSVADTGLDLKSGTIVGRVNQLPAGSKYEVKTPSSVIAINATRGPVKYQISANGTAHVEDGQVVVARTGAAVLTVNAGQTFNATCNAQGTVTATNPQDLLKLSAPKGGTEPANVPTAPPAPTVEFVAPVPEVSTVTGG